MKLDEFVSGTIKEQQNDFSNFINNAGKDANENGKEKEEKNEEFKFESGSSYELKDNISDDDTSSTIFEQTKENIKAENTKQQQPINETQKPEINNSNKKIVLGGKSSIKINRKPVEEHKEEIPPKKENKEIRKEVPKSNHNNSSSKSNSFTANQAMFINPEDIERQKTGTTRREQISQSKASRITQEKTSKDQLPNKPIVKGMDQKEQVNNVQRSVSSNQKTIPEGQNKRSTPQNKNVVTKEEMMRNKKEATRQKEEAEKKELEELFLKSETPEHYRERWFSALDKARHPAPRQKVNYVFERIARGRFTIRDDKVELLPDYDISGKSSKDMLNDKWL